jgi:chromosome partitioning protein
VLEGARILKTIAICNNKGGVGKTTICLCLAGALSEMDLNVLLIDMDQQGSLSSSFLYNIHNFSPVITDVLKNDQLPLKAAIKNTDYSHIDIVPANLSLGKLESEFLSERDSHYFLADKLDEIKGEYDFILLAPPP